MTLIREDVWDISDATTPWPPTLLAYARAVRGMQEKPISDPTSWLFQAAVHGYSGPLAPRPSWNSCQHRTWYFLPWHRMYVYQFEQIIRSHVLADGGSEDWALPYWDYSNVPANSERRTLPHAFRQPSLPDGSANPLFVAQRRGGINTGQLALPEAVTNTTEAMAESVFTATSSVDPGFGGPVTGFAHLGNQSGRLESLPHDVVHGAIGGLMNSVPTAALDPIFWLHHCNVDRLWETWLALGNRNPTQDRRFIDREFALFDRTGSRVLMLVGSVLDTLQLDYTYAGLPSVAAVGAAARTGGDMSPEPRIAMVGRSDTELAVTPEGGRSDVTLGELPAESAAASEDAGPRFHLELADVTGERNPGAVYGIYVDLPADATAEERAAHEVGVVSFFGIEHTTGPDEHPVRYVFDITDVLRRIRADADPTQLQVTLVPLPGLEPEETAAAEAVPPVQVGTVAVLVSEI